MSQFSQMILHTKRYNDRIKRFCAPLFQQFGFNCVFYHYISEEGYGTSLGSHFDSFAYYFDQELYKHNPFAKHPKYLASGIYLIPEVESDPYQMAIQTEADQFDIDNKVVILEKTKEGCHGFSFGTSKNLKVHFDFLNDRGILECFIRRFKTDQEDILKHVWKDQLPIRDYIEDFDAPDVTFTTAQEKKITFLKAMGLIGPTDDIHFSSRERECIHLMLSGYTASQTADQLHLSKRTVEHYLENIKLKVNCFTKLELYEKCQELKALDLL